MLDQCGVNELRYAFENWNRNGRFFPKPKDILELVEAYRLSQTRKQVDNRCDAECKSRHGKGYGEQDMLWLFKKYIEKRGQIGRALNKSEIFSLLDELDKHRGWSPEWRKSA